MADYPNAEKIQKLKDLANKLRILSIQMTNASKSGHPTSCASMAELTSVLFYHTMKYKVNSPRDPSSDRFVLSKVRTGIIQAEIVGIVDDVTKPDLKIEKSSSPGRL